MLVAMRALSSVVGNTENAQQQPQPQQPQVDPAGDVLVIASSEAGGGQQHISGNAAAAQHTGIEPKAKLAADH